jgi:transcriptional regulator with XRE-family HTH domain
MAHPKKRTPTTRNKRLARDKKRAGGVWGDQLRERLGRLQQKAGGSNIKFGALVGVDPRRIGQWREGDALPGADNLKAIAQGTGASLDWVFFGTDAAGKPASEIQYRGQSRDMKTLEDDLAVAVWREIRASGTLIPDVDPSIYPPSLFKEAVEIVRRDLARFSISAGEERPLDEAITAITQMLYTVAPEERKADWNAALDGLISAAKNRWVRGTVVERSSLAYFRPEKDAGIPVFSGRISGGSMRNVSPLQIEEKV